MGFEGNKCLVGLRLLCGGGIGYDWGGGIVYLVDTRTLRNIVL